MNWTPDFPFNAGLLAKNQDPPEEKDRGPAGIDSSKAIGVETPVAFYRNSVILYWNT